MEKDKVIKKVWLTKEATDLVKLQSKLSCINHSEFIENCIFEHFKRTSKINKQRVKFNKSELEILKLMYENITIPFSITFLENLKFEDGERFSKRSVRDIVKRFFERKIIDKLDGKNKKFKCFNLSKKGIKMYEKL